jgi:hypothetical protein
MTGNVQPRAKFPGAESRRSTPLASSTALSSSGHASFADATLLFDATRSASRWAATIRGPRGDLRQQTEIRRSHSIVVARDHDADRSPARVGGDEIRTRRNYSHA